MNTILDELEKLVPALAQQEIMSRFNRVDYDLKSDGSLVTEADLAMQKAMVDALKSRWPQFDILGEEMSPEVQQSLLSSESEGLWVLDPLDGTSNFSSGIPIFSVSLALLQQGEVRLGLIYDPVRKECFSAIKDQGAWLNGHRLRLESEKTELKQCIAQVDLKRLSKELATKLAAEHPYASQRNFGSGALDWGWVAAGRSQVYLHGGQKLWDYLAGQLILKEAGGYVTTFNGEEVYTRALQPRSVVAAVNESLYREIKEFIA